MKTINLKQLIGITFLLFFLTCPNVFAVNFDDQAELSSQLVEMDFSIEDIINPENVYLALQGTACERKKRRRVNRCLRRTSNSARQCNRQARRALDRRNARAARNGDDDYDCLAGRRDNCPGVFNPGQRDANGDGVGDACRVIDLIVSGGYDEDEIFIFRDVLATGGITSGADVKIDSDEPRGLAVDSNTLYVGANNRIEIYENVNQLADGATPSKVFGPDTGIFPDSNDAMDDTDDVCDLDDYIHGVRVHNGDLYVLDTGASCLVIWRDVANKANGANPDVAIDLSAAGYDIDYARGFFVGDNQVVIGDYDDQGSTEAQLIVFRDAKNIVNATAPDVRIPGDVFDATGACGIEVHDNKLFVGGYEDDGQNYIFNDFSALTNASTPDVLIDDHPENPLDSRDDILYSNAYDFQFVGDMFISVSRWPESGDLSEPSDVGGFMCDTVLVWDSVPTMDYQPPSKVLCPDDSGSVVSATHENMLFIAHEESGFVSVYDDVTTAENNATPDKVFFDFRMKSAHHMTLTERVVN